MAAFFKYGSEDMTEILVFPNPFVETLTIRFQAENVGMLPISIQDLVGRQVYSGVVLCDQGKNEVSLTVDLPAGVYLFYLGDSMSRVILTK